MGNCSTHPRPSLTSSFIRRYGFDEVKSWNFESWNEPDHRDFGNINFTKTGFLNYFNATRTGVKSVSKGLIFGGPAGSCREPRFADLCYGVLNNSNVDFVSFHRKGQDLVNGTLDKVKLLLEKFPNLKGRDEHRGDGGGTPIVSFELTSHHKIFKRLMDTPIKISKL